MTFELEEITDEVTKKVVFAKYTNSSGLGGVGSITAITEEGQEYFLGLHGYDTREKEREVLNLFLGKEEDSKEHFADTENRWGFKDMGSWLCKWVLGSQIFVRKDFFDKFIYGQNQDKNTPLSALKIARDLLNPQGKLPQMVLAQTQTRMDKEERERREREEWKVRNRLVEGEDYEWKKFDSGYACEYCLLLFKENEDGTISGSKWTIVCQREQFDEGGCKGDAPVEAYNLYYKSYENMGGILDYPEDGKMKGKEIHRYTTLDDPQWHDYGRFHRIYFTLEQAKAAALKRNEFLGWGNYYKTNLLKRNWSEMSLEEAKKDYFRAVKREKELQLLFPQICGEFLRIAGKHDQLFYAQKELCESLGLSGKDIPIINSFFRDASMFTSWELERTEKLLAEAEEIMK